MVLFNYSLSNCHSFIEGQQNKLIHWVLIKMIKVTPNINQPKSSDTNKRKRVITSIPYRAQSEIYASGRV